MSNFKQKLQLKIITEFTFNVKIRNKKNFYTKLFIKVCENLHISAKFIIRTIIQLIPLDGLQMTYLRNLVNQIILHVDDMERINTFLSTF